jgi:N-acetylmuramoyl-L-alanine amidase
MRRTGTGRRSAVAARWRLVLGLAFGPLTASVAVPACAVAQAAGQPAPELVIEGPAAGSVSVRASSLRGHAAVPLSTFEGLGWSATEAGGRISLARPDGPTVALTVGSPFLRWNGQPLQLADAPYVEAGAAYVPVQMLSDVLPERLPGLYAFDVDRWTLRVLGAPGDADAGVADAGVADAGGADTGAAGSRAGAAAERTPSPPALARPSPYDGVRVVWIDAGHGGADPGALGPGGIREKDVALGIARELQKILGKRRDLDVRMTRDDDSFVDVWDRGLLATEVKGDRPAIFISIHANSFPVRRTVRGFETYFLADARTEHERRVSAIENAPLSIRGRGLDVNRQSDLDIIFRELRNLDHQHWSALLAQMIQEELGSFHPGPNRGVKQGPLAVLTNALMPSVLVEIGYLSNQDEARLISGGDFQRRSAEAISDAVLGFFERYPPGSATGGRR